MSDQWDDYDDENETGNQPQQQGKGMRAQLEKALKENTELKTKLAETQKQLRSEAVARVIQSKGLKGKVAKLIPGDVEPNEEAITKWLDEWGDVLGIDNLKETKSEGDIKPPPPVENSGDDDLSNAQYAEKMAALGRATQQAAPPMKEEDMLKRLQDPNLDRKALMEMINAAGGGYGVG